MMNKKVKWGIIILVIIIVIVVAWILISPAFRVIERNEASSEGLIIAEGVFVPNAHDVNGKALIITNETTKILRFEDFETIDGPDLRIYLSSGLNIDDAIDLGPIKATRGNVNYDITGIDTDKYDKALVWCRAFKVLFSHAELGNA